MQLVSNGFHGNLEGVQAATSAEAGDLVDYRAGGSKGRVRLERTNPCH
jgi:hypothetical protein